MSPELLAAMQGKQSKDARSAGAATHAKAQRQKEEVKRAAQKLARQEKADANWNNVVHGTHPQSHAAHMARRWLGRHQFDRARADGRRAFEEREADGQAGAPGAGNRRFSADTGAPRPGIRRQLTRRFSGPCLGHDSPSVADGTRNVRGHHRTRLVVLLLQSSRLAHLGTVPISISPRFHRYLAVISLPIEALPICQATDVRACTRIYTRTHRYACLSLFAQQPAISQSRAQQPLTTTALLLSSPPLLSSTLSFARSFAHYYCSLSNSSLPPSSLLLPSTLLFES